MLRMEITDSLTETLPGVWAAGRLSDICEMNIKNQVGAITIRLTAYLLRLVFTIKDYVIIDIVSNLNETVIQQAYISEVLQTLYSQRIETRVCYINELTINTTKNCDTHSNFANSH